MSRTPNITELLRQQISFQRSYVGICQSVTAALFLSQAFYWTPRTSREQGWFYKTAEDWTDETGLTRHEQESARKTLRDLGLLEENYQRTAHRLWFRINMDKLNAEAIDWAEKEKERRRIKEDAKALPKSGSAPWEHFRKAEVPLPTFGTATSESRNSSNSTKNTAETTTENTPEPGAEAAPSGAGAPEACASWDGWRPGDVEAPASGANANQQSRPTPDARGNDKGGGDLFTAEQLRPTQGPSIEGMKYASWFSGTLPEGFGANTKQLREWAGIYDKLKRIDGRTKEEITAITQWARAHEFWSTKVLGPSWFRAKQKKSGHPYWAVFTDLMRIDKKKNGPATVPIRKEDLPEIMDMSDDGAEMVAFRARKAEKARLDREAERQRDAGAEKPEFQAGEQEAAEAAAINEMDEAFQ